MNRLCRAALMAVLATPASGFSATPGAATNGHCQPVGGSVFTNFVDATDAVGPVSGDLAGAVSVQILAVNGNVYHIRKHFVTTSGDTMTVADTDFTTYPTGSGVAAANGTHDHHRRHRALRRRYGERDLLRSDQRRWRGDVALLGGDLLQAGNTALMRQLQRLDRAATVRSGPRLFCR